MSFEALLADLDALQKAQQPALQKEKKNKKGKPPFDPDEENTGGESGDESPRDDAAIRAAASGDADDDGTPDRNDLPEDEDEDEDDPRLGKAFTLTDPDGRPVKTYDGTRMMKGFHARLSTLESDVLAALNQQSALIKSLYQEVHQLKRRGQGRQSVLNVHDKPMGAFSAPPAASPQALLAKALSAQKGGRMTGQDVARVETYLDRGLALPADLAVLLN